MRTQIGPYRIVAPLGRGGMGIVHRGLHENLGRPVAIKALAPELTQQPEFKERFFAEAKTQARLQHPNIVGVYDLLADGDEYFIVMELVEGEGLDDRLRAATGGGMDFQEAAGVFSQVLAALDYAHSEGVIHRDIKPSNVMVTAAGRVKLTDFGIALLIGDKRLTASQSSIGTPTYMSPEQILRPRTVDHRTDLYSAAVVFYEMLAGRPPFDDDTEYGIKKLHVEAPPPDISQLRPGLPAGAIRALATALSKNPDDRYPSGGMFLRALQEAAPQALPQGATPLPAPAHRPTVVEPVKAVSPPRRSWKNRQTLLAAAAGLALVIVLAAALLLLKPGGGEETEAMAAAPAPSPPAAPLPALSSEPLPEPPAPVLETAEAPVPPPPALQLAPPKPVRKKTPQPVAASVQRVSPPSVMEAVPVEPAAPAAIEEPRPAVSANAGIDPKDLEVFVLSLERASQEAFKSYRGEGRKDELFHRLEAFRRGAEDVRKEFRRTTGTGPRGAWARIRGRGGDATGLGLKVQSLTRQTGDIDGSIGSSSPVTQGHWREVRANLERLREYF